MKTKALLLVAALLALPLAVFPQNERNRADRQAQMAEIRAKQVAFISDRVGLTPEEAQVFWPIYNEFQAKKMAMRRELRSASRNAEGVNFQEVNELRINNIMRQAELERERYTRLLGVLSAEKIYKLHRAEADFQRELLRNVGQRGGERPAERANRTRQR